MSVRLPVSLLAVRQDTDLPAAGGMRDRQLLNRQLKGSGEVSLAAFHNTINGFQRQWDGYGGLSTGKTGPYFYLDNNFTTGSSYKMSGNQVELYVLCWGDTYQDMGTEARVNGKFTHTGNYVNASCSCDGTQGSPSAGVGYGQFSLVVAYGGNYLYGTVEVLASEQIGTSARTVNLRSDNPIYGNLYYLTLVAYSMIFDGYGQYDYTHRFRDMKIGLG